MNTNLLYESPSFPQNHSTDAVNSMAVPTVRLILADFWAYLKRPDYTCVAPLLWNEKPVGRAWRLFRAGFLMSLLGAIISQPLIRYAERLTDTSLRQDHGVTGWELVLILFTIVPLVEEGIFRLPLRPTITRVWWMVLALAVDVSVQIYFRTNGSLRYLLLTGSWLGLGLVATLVTSYKSVLRGWWERNFRWLFYASAISFGLVHLINCSNLTVWHWLLAPVITLPQLMAGFFNGYVRMNYGFWYAVAMHAMTNAVPAVMAAITLITG